MNTATSKDGTELAYDVSGHGPPLVYITGATCFRRFRPIVGDVKVFATEFTVYNYDRRGRGDSGDVLPYAIEREVDDIEAIVDAAGGRAILYGHSSGAALALEAAARMPEKIDRVVIYDASYAHDEAEQVSYAQLAERVRDLLAKDENARALKTFLQGIGMPRVFIALLPLFPGWKTMQALAPTLLYDIAITEVLPPVERFMGIEVPVQVVVGEKSPPELHQVARALADAVPRSSHRMLAGQDHMVSAKVLLPILTDSAADR